MINWINWPHTVHYVDLPGFAWRVQYLLPRLWRQLRHRVDHVRIRLQKVRSLKVSQIDVGDVPAEIVFFNLFMAPMRLRLVVTIARLRTVVVRREHFWERILLLKPSIHVPWLVAFRLEIVMVHREPHLWRLQIVPAIGHRILLPVLWYFPFSFDWILIYHQLLVVRLISRWQRCRWGQGPIHTLEHSEIAVKAFLSLIQFVPRRSYDFRSSFPLLLVTSLKVEAWTVAELTLLSLLYFIHYLLYTLILFI